MRIRVSNSAHVCEQMLTIVNEDRLSAADMRVNKMTRLLTNVSIAARLERGDVSKFFRCAAPTFLKPNLFVAEQSGKSGTHDFVSGAIMCQDCRGLAFPARLKVYIHRLRVRIFSGSGGREEKAWIRQS